MKRILFLLVVIFTSCESDSVEEFTPEISAEAKLYSVKQTGENQYAISRQNIGTAIFGQSDNLVQLTVFLKGMKPNTQKAVHIHNGTLEVPGRHWNQGYLFAACDSISLGRRWDKPFLGDVGNVTIDSKGNGQLTIHTDLWRINSGDNNDLLNKVMIIHENPQDFSNECTPNHIHNHSNNKIAGGMIKLISEIPQNEQPAIQMEKVPDFLICK
ncbi:MAG: superoxide dismutase family protein [Ekhidna sp.]|nr:superoxide dismutase family protein [Ekhidna sp.]